MEMGVEKVAVGEGIEKFFSYGNRSWDCSRYLRIHSCWLRNLRLRRNIVFVENLYLNVNIWNCLRLRILVISWCRSLCSMSHHLDSLHFRSFRWYGWFSFRLSFSTLLWRWRWLKWTKLHALLLPTPPSWVYPLRQGPFAFCLSMDEILRGVECDRLIVHHSQPICHEALLQESTQWNCIWIC